jgi:hypothetical protein
MVSNKFTKEENMRRTLVFGALLVLSVIFFNPNILYAFSFGSNLITNGDAEVGSGSPGGFVVSVPNWTTSGNFTVVEYTAGGGFPTTTDPGPGDRGTNFFAGGPSNSSSSASQSIDVTDGASAIDTGDVLFAVSGYLGGFASQHDNAILTAYFLNTSNLNLGTAFIGPVTNSDRGDLTGLLFRTTSGTIPIGTRTIKLDLNMTRLEGSYNDGYADNLSLVLTDSSNHTVIPEPSTMLLLGLGLIGVAGVRRKFSN